MLTDKEIENLANSHAEKEAFMKSTIVFVCVWLAGPLIFPLVPDRSYLFLRYIIPLRILYFVVSFLVAFVGGHITSRLLRRALTRSFTPFIRSSKSKQPFKVYDQQLLKQANHY